MKRLLTLSIVILVAAAGAVVAQDKVGTTAAPFLGIGTSAQGTAMGNSGVALAKGVDALFWNPAGIVQSDLNHAAFSVTNWFVGSQFQDASIIINAGKSGHFGARVVVLDYGQMEVTTIDRPEGTGERFTPMDISAALTYSRYLTTEFSFGITGKYIRQQIWNETASTVAFDLGLLYTSDFKNLRIGMAISNFGEDMQLFGDDLKVAHDIDPDQNGNNPRLPAYLETELWPLPLTYRVGLAIDALDAAENRVTLAFDAKHLADNSESLDVGFEYAFKEMVFARAGYRNLFTAVQEDGGFSFGFGLDYGLTNRNRLKLGYSYQLHEYLDNPQIWTLGVTF